MNSLLKPLGQGRMLLLTFEILFLCFVASTTYLEIMFELFRYPFRIWMTSVLAGPVLLLIFSLDSKHGLGGVWGHDLLQFYSIAVLLAGVVSIPCFLFLWLCYSMLVRWNCTPWIIKTALLFVSLLTCITVFACFSLIDSQSFWHIGNLKLVGAFALPLAFGVIVYKLK